MTAPLTYLATDIAGQKVHTRTGWPTTTPGLVVSRGGEVYESGRAPCCGTPCWRVVHLRSGCKVAGCMTSPEQAGHLAEQLGPLTDWTVSVKEFNNLPHDIHVAAGRLVSTCAVMGQVRPVRPERTPLEQQVERVNTEMACAADHRWD